MMGNVRKRRRRRWWWRRRSVIEEGKEGVCDVLAVMGGEG